MMLENLEKVQSATQSYMDTVEKAMRGFPGANEEQITTFKAYLERKVAANRDICAGRWQRGLISHYSAQVALHTSSRRDRGDLAIQ
jgi:hypothetical protein